MRNLKAVIVGAAALVSGCSFASEALWPSLTGDEPQSASAQRASPPTASPPPQLASAEIQPLSVTNLQPTGTFVGQKTAQLRGELRKLQGKLQAQNQGLQQVRAETNLTAQRYHGTVAAIQAKLQLGTTPGNPVLVSQWNAAQAELDRISTDVAAMNTLANDVAGNSSLAAYVMESARAAYSLAGAIDEDHRQLAILEDETNRTIVLVDRLLGEINEDSARQTAYIGSERSNLATLSMAVKNGELLGTSLFGRAYAARGERPIYATSPTPRSGFRSSGRQPLVVIRFDRPDVPFERALYSVVARILENRPEAEFDVVAVTPTAGKAGDVALGQSQSKRNANKVLRSLTDMGMPASRVSLSSTTSPGIAAGEVHVYLR